MTVDDMLLALMRNCIITMPFPKRLMPRPADETLTRRIIAANQRVSYYQLGDFRVREPGYVQNVRLGHTIPASLSRTRSRAQDADLLASTSIQNGYCFVARVTSSEIGIA